MLKGTSIVSQNCDIELSTVELQRKATYGSCIINLEDCDG